MTGTKSKGGQGDTSVMQDILASIRADVLTPQAEDRPRVRGPKSDEADK